MVKNWNPGFALFKLTNARAGVSPTLTWKWSKVCGKIIISPLFNVLKYAVLSELINPAIIVPSITNITSDTLCEWIGTTPPTPMSNLAMERPRPFKAGKVRSNAAVTPTLKMFEVLPATPRPEKTKSSTVRLAGFLQGYPAGPTGKLKSATQKSMTLVADVNETRKEKIMNSFGRLMLGFLFGMLGVECVDYGSLRLT